MKSKIIILMVLILLAINIAYAADSRTTWDDKRPNEFDYSIGDISSVPSDKLDLDKVYANDKYKDLTEEQIAHYLSKINDLSKLDEIRLNNAINKQEWGKEKILQVKDCVFCTISNDGTLKNGIAGAVVQVKDYPQGTAFVAKQDGGVDIIVPNGNSLNMPKITQSTIVPEVLREKAATDNSITIKGNNIKFSDGSKLNLGSLKIESDKRFVIEQGSFTTQDNVVVQSDVSPTEIIFGEIKDTEQIPDINYVQFERNNKRVLVHGDGFFVMFRETNPYINTMSDAENLVVTPKNKGTITIEQTENKAPSITLTGPATRTYWGSINNGQYNVILGKFGVVDLHYGYINRYDTTPVEILVIGDNQLSTITKDLNQYKVVINDKGELKIADYDADIKPDGTFTCPKQKCEIPFEYLMSAGTRKDIKTIYDIDVIYGTKKDLERLKEILDATPPEVLANIKRVEFVAHGTEISGENLGGGAYPYGTIQLISEDPFSQSDVAHETAHTNTNAIIQRDYRLQLSNLKEQLAKGEITKENFDLELSKLNRDYIDSKEAEFGHVAATFSPFVKEWTQVAGDVYGKTTQTVIVDGQPRLVWVDEQEKFSEAPRHGCIIPYGCKTFREDVATYTEAFKTYEGTYKIKNNLNDPRVRQKVYLQWKYKLITDEQYKEVGSPQPSP